MRDPGRQNSAGGPDDAQRFPALRLEGVSKSFGGYQALNNASFEVFAGEVHALLGENGAGKSTLIKILTGVYQPDAGEVLLRGRRQRFQSPRHPIAAARPAPTESNDKNTTGAP